MGKNVVDIKYEKRYNKKPAIELKLIKINYGKKLQ